MSTSELHALIDLLDDPDEGVYRHVHDILMGRGPEVLSLLQRPVEEVARGAVHADRIEALMAGLRSAEAVRRMRAWIEGGARDRFEGWLAVEGGLRPELDVAGNRGLFERLCRDVWLECNEGLTALEQVLVLNHVLFAVREVRIVPVLPVELHQGLPEGLLRTGSGNAHGVSMLYAACAQRLGFPLYPLAGADPLLLGWFDGGSEILFAVHPSRRGTVFAPGDLVEFGVTGPVRPMAPADTLVALISSLQWMQEHHGKSADAQCLHTLVKEFSRVAR